MTWRLLYAAFLSQTDLFSLTLYKSGKQVRLTHIKMTDFETPDETFFCGVSLEE